MVERKTTHGLLAKAFRRVPDVIDALVRPFGVKKPTVVSWARPKASDEDLYGTGKGNPLDRVVKLLDELHVFDPEMAREIAEYFPLIVDELDRRTGFNEADEVEHACKAIARVVEGNAKLITASLGGCDNPRTVSECLNNAEKLKTNVLQLIACLRRVLVNNGENEQ